MSERFTGAPNGPLARGLIILSHQWTNHVVSHDLNFNDGVKNGTISANTFSHRGQKSSNERITLRRGRQKSGAAGFKRRNKELDLEDQRRWQAPGFGIGALPRGFTGRGTRTGSAPQIRIALPLLLGGAGSATPRSAVATSEAIDRF